MRNKLFTSEHELTYGHELCFAHELFASEHELANAMKNVARGVGNNPYQTILKFIKALFKLNKKDCCDSVVFLRTVFQKYGISLKRYAVFFVCVYKRSACQEN